MINYEAVEKVFQFDTLICATQGILLSEYMMRKHGWEEATYEKWLTVYKQCLSLSAKETKELNRFKPL